MEWDEKKKEDRAKRGVLEKAAAKSVHFDPHATRHLWPPTSIPPHLQPLLKRLQPEEMTFLSQYTVINYSNVNRTFKSRTEANGYKRNSRRSLAWFFSRLCFRRSTMHARLYFQRSEPQSQANDYKKNSRRSLTRFFSKLCFRRITKLLSTYHDAAFDVSQCCFRRITMHARRPSISNECFSTKQWL